MNSLRYIRPVLIVTLAVAVGWLGGRRWERARESPPIDTGRIELSSGPPDAGEDALRSRSVSLADDERDTIRIYEERNRAVVNINTETVAYNWFLEPIPQEGTSGSGSIIDERGYVLTNNHVVESAARVYVTLADGERLEGEVVGQDAENDLAVVRFDPDRRRLETIPMGESDSLRIGQRVMAIGNPFGLDRTLTIGIVSGLGRPIRARNDLVIRDMIQTDSSINRGTSGGPLLNSRGEMIGINTMIFSPSGGSVGIGFAVPVNTARRVIPDLIEFGVVQRGWIDVIPRQLFPRLVQYARLSVEEGLLVSEVVPGGNAAEIGLRGGDRNDAVRYGRTVIYLGGDIITAVDGTAVASIANLYEALEDNRPGETVIVEYIRGRRRLETEIVLSERPTRFQWD
ncbi:MAG: trypsin-like peptidase domain-containing protein [Spirochaetales bacterium]|nr:trypsin-like peptidase domain-containing protein [Spirochaetales bacterium]